MEGHKSSRITRQLRNLRTRTRFEWKVLQLYDSGRFDFLGNRTAQLLLVAVNMTIISFRDLLVWRRSMVLTEKIYSLTESFSRAEMYGLTAQLRRCAVSIPSNIAEGHARKTGHYLEHLDTASGSAAELQTQLELVFRLKLADKRRVDPIIREAEEIGRMLHGLAASVAASAKKEPAASP